MKNKYLFIVFFLLVSIGYAKSIKAITNNCFIKDTYEKNELKIKYSSVVKFNTASSDDYESQISFNLYLASFFIEEVSYKGIIYREHDLFGHTFPKELLVNLNIDLQVSYDGAVIPITTVISSFNKIKYPLGVSQSQKIINQSNSPKSDFERGIGFSLKAIKTNKIDFPIEGDLFSKIINSIQNNKKEKSEKQKEVEYFRLLTEGNLLLSENNYNASLTSYNIAKSFTNDTEFIDSKIDIVNSYLSKNKTKYRWINREKEQTVTLNKKIRNQNHSKIDFATDFQSSKDQKKYSELETEANVLLYKNKFKEATNKLLEARKLTSNTKVVDEKIKVIERFQKKSKALVVNKEVNKKSRRFKEKASRPEKDPVQASVENIEVVTEIEVDTSLSYPELLRKGSEFLGKKEYKKSKAYFEEAKKKASDPKIVDTILKSVNKLVGSPNTIVVANNKVVTEPKEYTAGKAKTSQSNQRLFKKEDILDKVFNDSSYDKGYIKYKRDQQAVLNANGKMLIPFGEYQILRYREGFAKIKIKDSVDLKTIECTGRNNEYSWSARIFQNPWIETTIDNKGEYVEELTKRVEIYVVDNVSMLPWDEVPQSTKDAYKDPNKFTGTDFYSAFNIWERENARKPEVIARRKEIQDFKDLSKVEAYRGADSCKNDVAKSLEEVYNYYKGLGYDIKIKY